MLSTFLFPHPNPLSSKKPNISPPISMLTHSVSHTGIYWGSTMSCAPRERGWNHTQPCSWDHGRLGEMERHSNVDHHCNLARTVGWHYPLSVPTREAAFLSWLLEQSDIPFVPWCSAGNVFALCPLDRLKHICLVLFNLMERHPFWDWAF